MPHTPRGQVEVICGCMFSGKSEELIRRLRRAEIARMRVRVFKPAIDNRYAAKAVVSHLKDEFPCIPVERASQIRDLCGGCDVVGIDEVQFMNGDVIKVVEDLAKHGKRVIVAGLDLDAFEKPFGPMPELLVRADYITKLHAVCVVCGEDATRSYRKSGTTGQVEVGSAQYEARCRGCYHHGPAAAAAVA